MSAILDYFRTGPDVPCTLDPDSVRREFTWRRWSAFLSVTLGYCLFYTCRVNFSVVKKSLIDDGIFDATDLGVIGSVMLVVYAVGKLTNGFLADRANVKRFMSAALLGSALLNLVLGFTPWFWVFVVAWAFNGWCQSVGAAPSVVVLSQWFSRRERGTFYGMWSTSHNMGEGLTFAVTSFLVAEMGWEWGFWGPGLLCVVAAVVLSFTLQDRPQTRGLPSVAEYRKDSPDPANEVLPVGALQAEVLKSPAIWILAFASAAMYVARYGINSWGILYLQEGKGYDLETAGSILAVAPTCGALGAISSGFISDLWFGSRRNVPALLFGVALSAALATLYLGPADCAWLDTASMAVFGFSMGVLLVYLGGLMAVDIVSSRAAGAAMGLVGIFSYLGAAIQDSVSGMLIDAGRVAVEDGPATYDFGPVFWFWFGASVLSFLLAASVWNAGKRRA